MDTKSQLQGRSRYKLINWSRSIRSPKLTKNDLNRLDIEYRKLYIYFFYFFFTLPIGPFNYEKHSFPTTPLSGNTWGVFFSIFQNKNNHFIFTKAYYNFQVDSITKANTELTLRNHKTGHYHSCKHMHKIISKNLYFYQCPRKLRVSNMNLPWAKKN